MDETFTEAWPARKAVWEIYHQFTGFHLSANRQCAPESWFIHSAHFQALFLQAWPQDGVSGSLHVLQNYDTDLSLMLNFRPVALLICFPMAREEPEGLSGPSPFHVYCKKQPCTGLPSLLLSVNQESDLSRTTSGSWSSLEKVSDSQWVPGWTYKLQGEVGFIWRKISMTQCWLLFKVP